MSTVANLRALPAIFVTKQIVNERIKNYQNVKLPLLENGMNGRRETKSAWYSKQQFEEIVDEMRLQNADGIRVYFAAYGPNDPEYANQLTVVFVPTSWNTQTNKHTDVIIDDQVDFLERRKIPSDTMNLDTIGLCPPTCLDQGTMYPF